MFHTYFIILRIHCQKEWTKAFNKPPTSIVIVLHATKSNQTEN